MSNGDLMCIAHLAVIWMAFAISRMSKCGIRVEKRSLHSHSRNALIISYRMVFVILRFSGDYYYVTISLHRFAIIATISYFFYDNVHHIH